MSAFRGTNGHSVQGSSEDKDKVFQKIEPDLRKRLDEIVKEINEGMKEVDEKLKKSIYRGTL